MPASDAAEGKYSSTLDLSVAAVLVQATTAFCRESTDDALELVVGLVRRATDGCSYASCMVRHPTDGLSTRGATHEEAVVLDELQHSARVGPGLEAIRANEVVHVADLAAENRWPAFRRNGARFAGSLVAVPFADPRRPDRAIGSLNLYAAERDAFSSAAMTGVGLIAAHLGASLTMATTIEQQLIGLASRDTIGQAKGILMARQGFTSDEAFHVLRRASQRQNRKLRDVAEELVHGGGRPIDPEDHPQGHEPA